MKNQLQKNTSVLLVNLGTPDSYEVGDVSLYLQEFLMDERVIDIPPVSRYMLVNCIIAPFRSPKSAKIYKKVWTDEGSPIKVTGFKLKELLQKEFGADISIHLAMRYKNPSIASTLETIRKENPKHLIVVPLFPQYASATTGSIIQEVHRCMAGWQNFPKISMLSEFYDNENFINASANIAQEYKPENYDHILFSYHGLPERQIKKAEANNQCLTKSCCDSINDKNHRCYRAQCFATTRLLVEKLGLKEGQYSTVFQSRLGKAVWIQPYADETIKHLASNGVKKILAFSPSFVADCLETTIEIGEEYNELFQEHGGEKLQLVESLNANAAWVKTLSEMINSVV